jgi:signal transduction histidine kinase
MYAPISTCAITAEILLKEQLMAWAKFSKSMQQKTDTGDSHPLGLELLISKSIIEAHEGKMWAENNLEGRGSTFYFTLLLKKIDVSQ